MKTLLRLLLKTHHQRNRSGSAQTEKGMTLVELLVGSIMAFLIITPMLGFVVDMLNTDRREQVKSNTEQDLQAAVDFISQDLSQAIHIYDGKAINEIRSKLPEPTNVERIPILVFWKRQLMRKSIPVDPSTVKPKDCDKNECNDTYLLSLVAYYQFKDTDNTWCQPSGGNCPTRIARYEIRDGIKNPLTQEYYKSDDSETTKGQRKDTAFNEKFQLNKPTVDVTAAADFPNPEVLVNYIDYSSTNVPLPPDCKIALGVVDPTEAGSTPINAADLLITDRSSKPTHSFYACVDTSKNIARVTIRGNSLRRLQADAPYNKDNPAFFPTASVQVKGLSGLGK
ncbi:hormogonium polysaccharide secretion pseudopilin HpsC [Tychonema sp. BBK16]|uniref:hormogonium polysaccharide secretion pseudopilin HpsC n=1 Tax=Tychonema sp. BBK16 TaxID=2699888 RepID=UPI001F30316E|nr:hormogonium polysaccharide secretion pseudopilin HpsC [Tychonema sp. BBK16]MCF6374724.1 hormogonium polysaccharide secretion pseudopilin HpsC [Tychonema sp. BBK16]